MKLFYMFAFGYSLGLGISSIGHSLAEDNFGLTIYGAFLFGMAFFWFTLAQEE